MSVDIEDLLKYTRAAWSPGGFALEGLMEIMKIPNGSPAFDPEFHTNGLILQALDMCKRWIDTLGLKGLTTHVHPTPPGKEPLLYAIIEGYKPDAGYVLTYGHLDKMPPLDQAGWGEGLGPYKPVVRDGNLYGRGSNDDLFNPYTVLTSMKYLQERNLPYPKMFVILETAEESGNNDIFGYLEELKDVIGEPGFMMILDGECLDYDRFWYVNSLRGTTDGILTVEHLATPCHSGMATGIAPSTFRIARKLLSRIEDEDTGEVLLPEANLDFEHDPVIKKAREELIASAPLIGEHLKSFCKLREGAQPVTNDLGELLVWNLMKPGIEIVSQDGIPPIANGSNVVRAKTALKISMRLPPGVDGEVVSAAMKKKLEEDPPYGAKVEFAPMRASTGYICYEYRPKFLNALKEGSVRVFGNEPVRYGLGGSIPLATVMKHIWPNADIFATGCSGPDGNPHGYNELLNLEYTAKFAASFAVTMSLYAD